MKNALLLLSFCFITALSLSAQSKQHVPAIRTPLEYIQPDGDTLTIRLHGDERHSYRTTADGYLIAQDKKGYYCYAKYNNKGIGKATRRKAHNADQRSACEQKYIARHIPNKLSQKND